MMKKILFSILSVASATALFVLSNNKIQQIPLLSDNIEALTRYVNHGPEGPSGYDEVTEVLTGRCDVVTSIDGTVTSTLKFGIGSVLDEKDKQTIKGIEADLDITFHYELMDCYMMRCLSCKDRLQPIDCKKLGWTVCSSRGCPSSGIQWNN